MKLLVVAGFAVLTTAAALPQDAQECIDSGDCVIVRKADLQRFLDQMRAQYESKIWCRNS